MIIKEFFLFTLNNLLLLLVLVFDSGIFGNENLKVKESLNVCSRSIYSTQFFDVIILNEAIYRIDIERLDL